MVKRVPLALMSDNVSHELGVCQVVLPANEWPNKPHDLSVIHVVKESIRSHDEDVVMVDVVHLSVGAGRVIATCSDLVWEVEAVGLLFRTEHRE